MRSYWTAIGVVIVALLVYCASAWVPIGDCDGVSNGDDQLCSNPRLYAYLAQNLAFLREGPAEPNKTAAVEARREVVTNALTFGRKVKEEAPQAPSTVAGVDTPLEAAVETAVADFAAALAKVELTRAQVFARDLTAWLTLSSAETTARVFWMSTLGAVTIALVGLAFIGVSMTMQASRALTENLIFRARAVAGFFLLWVAVGLLSYFKLDLFFLETWPARFVEGELRGDLSTLLRWQYSLLGFGAVALLTGVSFRLVMPTDLSSNEKEKAREWLFEVSEDVNRAILVVAATVVLGVVYVNAILSWPLALVGGCGENQILPEVLAACGTISYMVMGTGLLGSLVLGAIVLPAMMIIRSHAQRLATQASPGTESAWLEQVGLAESYWGMIARIAAVFAPLLPGLLASLTPGIATLAS